MAKRQKLWAKRKRKELIDALGGCCKKCGTEDDLCFDCIIPTGDEHHKGSTDQRILFYLKMNKIGNLQLLCQKHNSSKGSREQRIPELREIGKILIRLAYAESNYQPF